MPGIASRQHARRLAEGARAVIEKVQDLMDDDDVERVARQREVVDVALAHAAMFQSGAVEPLARQRQHVERQIETEPALDIAGKQFEHPPGAGAEIKHAPRLVRLQHMVKQQEAAARGAVMPGAEGQRRLDLDGKFVFRHALAVMRAMDDKAAGRHRHEIFEARLDPVPGFNGVEGEGVRDLRTRGIAHELAQQRLVRRLGKMHGDVPAPVRPLERRHRRLALEEDLGQHIDHALGGVLVANGKTGAVGGRRDGHRKARSTANGEEKQGLFTGFSPSHAPEFHNSFTLRAA